MLQAALDGKEKEMTENMCKMLEIPDKASELSLSTSSFTEGNWNRLKKYAGKQWDKLTSFSSMTNIAAVLAGVGLLYMTDWFLTSFFPDWIVLKIALREFVQNFWTWFISFKGMVWLGGTIQWLVGVDPNSVVSKS